MPLIELRSLYKRYGEKEALKDINIKVERGEVLAIIGPTGAGKTTLLYLLDLLEMPTSGRIYLDGMDVTKPEKVRLEARRRMAFVSQKPIVFNTTVYNNIAYGLKWRGTRRSSLHQKVSDILEMFKLSDYKNRNARTLSGGETQMVAIARAIALEPEVLLLDEPTANLDPLSTSRIEELLTNIFHRYDATIIMATHDMSQGQRFADRIVVLMNGEIHQAGGLREVFASPRDRAVAEFVGIENIIDGRIVASEDGMVAIDINGKIVEAVSDYQIREEVCICVRPENITLTLTKVSSSARNSFEGEITLVVSVGPLTRVEVDCGFPLLVLVTKRSAEEMDLAKGKKVYTTFKATGVHIIK